MSYVMKREYIYGWDFTEFGDNEKPIVYSTKEEADKQLAEYIEDVNDAFKRGDMDSPYEGDCKIFKLEKGELCL